MGATREDVDQCIRECVDGAQLPAFAMDAGRDDHRNFTTFVIRLWEEVKKGARKGGLSEFENEFECQLAYLQQNDGRWARNMVVNYIIDLLRGETEEYYDATYYFCARYAGWKAAKLSIASEQIGVDTWVEAMKYVDDKMNRITPDCDITIMRDDVHMQRSPEQIAILKMQKPARDRIADEYQE